MNVCKVTLNIGCCQKNSLANIKLKSYFAFNRFIRDLDIFHDQLLPIGSVGADKTRVVGVLYRSMDIQNLKY